MIYCKIPTTIVILMYTTRKILIAVNHAHKKSGFFFAGQFLRGYEGKARLVGSSLVFPSRDSELGYVFNRDGKLISTRAIPHIVYVLQNPAMCKTHDW